MAINRKNEILLRVDTAITESTLTEARNLQPAIITMKRGTVIKADHHRVLKSKGLVVVGIGPGNFEAYDSKPSRPNKKLCTRLRDFYGPQQYVPPRTWVVRGFVDETGWMQPNQFFSRDGVLGYSARKDSIIPRKFRDILTINIENILSIEQNEHQG
jgi:hypothetical protein